MSDIIVIDNIIYQIEDEQLDEISYYEILSMDQIIKDNPTFIAFSKDEIFDELYDFFKNSSKANSLSELFFKDNKQNIKNIVFVSNATKKEQDCDSDDTEQFVKTVEKLTKQQYRTSQTEKNKLFFALTYDNQDTHLRIKPYMNTTIQLQNNKYKYRTFYPIYESDDTNIPILAAYYKTPKTTCADYLSDHISSYLYQQYSFNYIESNSFKDIKKLLEIVKPKIETILKTELDKDDFYLDYNHLNAFLERFDTCLDDINIADFDKLKHYLDNIKNIQPDKINYVKHKIQPIKITNHKLEFFNKLNNINSLLNFSDKTKADYELLISKLQDEKIDTNAVPLLYNNINDIVNALMNRDVEIDDILHNLSINRKILIIDNSINNLKNITQNDIENITILLNELTKKFTDIKEALHDIFEFHFIDFYNDIKEVKEANDHSDYDGIPDIYRNEGNYEGMGEIADDQDEIELDETDSKISNISLEKYWLSIKYKESNGFVEILKIILPILNKVQNKSRLNLNMSMLCDILYNKFAGVSSKYNLMYNILKKNDINVVDQYIQEIIKITPNIVLQNNNKNDIMAQYVYQCNIEYIDVIFNMLYYSLAWWSIQIQEDIAKNTLIFNESLSDIIYIDKWSLDGMPLNNSKNGVLPYLATILEDTMIEINIYTVPTHITTNVMKSIDDYFKDIIEHIRELSKNIKKRANKGADVYNQLLDTFRHKKMDKLLNDYIDALIYMPSYKFKKIHKFLLGCCLQKIGIEFKIDSDLHTGNRKDLLGAKKYYAKNRETNKPRSILYAPKYDINDELEEFEESNEMNFIRPELELDDIEELSIKIKTIDDWLNNMKDKSSLLPNEFIDIFNKGTKEASVYSKEYINIFCKTAGGKAKDFELLFEKLFNYYNILNIICVYFKKYITENENEKILLTTSITTIHNIINDIEELFIIINEYNKQDIDRIILYIITRSLCLPCNPEIAINNVLQSSIDVSSNFINNITNGLYSSLIKYFNQIKMPSIEENIAMINSIREENKNKTLSIMNKKSQDDRNLMSQLKKIGLTNLDIFDEDQPIINQEIIEDDIQEGEKEFMKQDEEEYDDNTLDDENYGFIYS